AIAQLAYAVGFDFDDVTGLEVARRVTPCGGPRPRPRPADVAGYQRGEGRDIVDEVAEAEDQPSGAVVLPRLAVDARREPDVRDLLLVGLGPEPRTEASGRVEILALRHIELGVPHPVADGAFIAQRDGGDVIERRAFLDVAAGLADHEHQFALVVELGWGTPAHHRWGCADKKA